MSKNLLKKQKLNYSKNVLDIVQFGSSVLEESNPNDIDIAIIFQKIPLKNQLEESQKIKRQLEKLTDKKIHISNYNLYGLFDASNFAREGIIFYGKSLTSGNYFMNTFGLMPKIQISYSLDKLKKKDKVRFHYMLRGKKGKYGMPNYKWMAI